MQIHQPNNTNDANSIPPTTNITSRAQSDDKPSHHGSNPRLLAPNTSLHAQRILTPRIPSPDATSQTRRLVSRRTARRAGGPLLIRRGAPIEVPTLRTSSRSGADRYRSSRGDSDATAVATLLWDRGAVLGRRTASTLTVDQIRGGG